MTPEQIEAAARAMKPRAFGIYDKGYTNRNWFDERAFINAEKVVKRARKDAALALEAAEKVALGLVPVSEEGRA